MENRPSITSEDIAKMNCSEMDAMLTKMLSFAHYGYDNYILPIIEAEKKYDELKKEWEDFYARWKVTAGCVVIALFFFAGTCIFGAHKSYLTLGESMCWMGFGFFIVVAAILVLVNAVYIFFCLGAPWHYKKNCKAAAERIEDLRLSFHKVITETNVSDVLYGASVLPDYYLYPPAIEYMLKCIRNQQAASLGQAVTMYEQHVDHDKVIQQLTKINDSIRRYSGTTNYYTTVYPMRVLAVGLVALHGLGVLWMGKGNPYVVLFQDIENGDPVFACGFH